MASDWPLARTPFFFIGPRPYRETELAAYIRREHRRGRHLAEILNDSYLDRRGGDALLRAVLRRPSLIRALRQDVADAFRLQEAELEQTRWGSGARAWEKRGERPLTRRKDGRESGAQANTFAPPECPPAG